MRHSSLGSVLGERGAVQACEAPGVVVFSTHVREWWILRPLLRILGFLERRICFFPNGLAESNLKIEPTCDTTFQHYTRSFTIGIFDRDDSGLQHIQMVVKVALHRKWYERVMVLVT